MKFVVNVDRDRFDAFAKACPINHYSKTSAWPEVIDDEYPTHDLLGVENGEGELIATAIMMHKKTCLPGIKYSYIQYGFNLDIEDKDLISFFAMHLKEFARSKGSTFLRMDSNITRLEHDKNGKVVEGGFNHEYVTELLEDAGFTHLGYNYGYSGNWLSRYTYRNNLDKPWKKIKKGIKRYANYNNRNKLRDVVVRPAGYNELHWLVECEQELSQDLGFKPKPVEFFEKVWDEYGDDVRYYIVTTNYHQAVLNLEKEVADTKEHLNVLIDENKIALAKQNIATLSEEIEEIKASGKDIDEEVVLGAKFIIMQGENVWNVNMYTKKTFLNFRAAFALHSYVIEDVYKRGAKTYDFEGVSGSTDPNDYYYGLHEFKRSFGGDFLEYLGEFDAIFDEKKYKVWKKARTAMSLTRRKVLYAIYHKEDKKNDSK